MSSYAFTKLKSGVSAFEAVLSTVKSFPNVKSIIVLGDNTLEESEAYKAIRKDRWNIESLISELSRIGKSYDHLFYVFGDCYFLDAGITADMYETHKNYFAEYTFADGFPEGLSPEIIRTSILPSIQRLSEGNTDSVTRDSMFDVIQKDINAFDVETEISPRDLRHLRIFLTADSKRNVMLLERLIDKGISGKGDLLKILDTERQLLRTLPAYFPIQVVESCPQACTYCPYPKWNPNLLTADGKMDMERFYDIIERISSFCEDAVIGLSLWGEPAMHPQIAEIAAAVKRTNGLSLLLETSGIGWSHDTIDAVNENADDSVNWIISLDALDAELYKTLRGEGREKAHNTAKYLLERVPGNTYVQAVRMNENEFDLENFYRNWKKVTDHVIIQKFDHFCGFLPERKVTDLSPLERAECWHLKRDMPILMDGTVPMCSEVYTGTERLGNVFSHSLEEIWNKGYEYYIRHVSREYPDICKRCDEYYTYNF